eukprot:2376732-Rhodomonas_salina.1
MPAPFRNVLVERRRARWSRASQPPIRAADAGACHSSGANLSLSLCLKPAARDTIASDVAVCLQVVASFIASGLHESWASVHNKLRQYRLASNMYTLGLKPAKAVTPLPEKIAAVIPLTASEQHCVDLSRELAAKELVHDLRKVVKVPRLKKVSAPDVETALHAISERTVLEDEFPVQSILVNDLFKVAIRNVVDEVEVVTHGITKLAAVPPSAVSSATSAVSSAVSASTAVSATSAVSATASA